MPNLATGYFQGIQPSKPWTFDFFRRATLTLIQSFKYHRNPPKTSPDFYLMSWKAIIPTHNHMQWSTSFTTNLQVCFAVLEKSQEYNIFPNLIWLRFPRLLDVALREGSGGEGAMGRVGEELPVEELEEIPLPYLKHPKTNITPENGWLEAYFPFGKAYFHRIC